MRVLDYHFPRCEQRRANGVIRAYLWASPVIAFFVPVILVLNVARQPYVFPSTHDVWPVATLLVVAGLWVVWLVLAIRKERMRAEAVILAGAWAAGNFWVTFAVVMD